MEITSEMIRERLQQPRLGGEIDATEQEITSPAVEIPATEHAQDSQQITIINPPQDTGSTELTLAVAKLTEVVASMSQEGVNSGVEPTVPVAPERNRRRVWPVGFALLALAGTSLLYQNVKDDITDTTGISCAAGDCPDTVETNSDQSSPTMPPSESSSGESEGLFRSSVSGVSTNEQIPLQVSGQANALEQTSDGFWTERENIVFRWEILNDVAISQGIGYDISLEQVVGSGVLPDGALREKFVNNTYTHEEIKLFLIKNQVIPDTVDQVYFCLKESDGITNLYDEFCDPENSGGI